MVRAQTGSTVKVHYTGRLADGEVFDSSLDPPGDSSGIGEPLGFVIGSGQMIPAFEQGVIGMEPGESKTVYIPAEQAYGPHSPQAVIEVERSQFPSGMPLEVGSVIQGNAPNGGAGAFHRGGGHRQPGDARPQSSPGRQGPYI